MTKSQAKALLEEVRTALNTNLEAEARLSRKAGIITAIASAKLVLDAAGVKDKALRKKGIDALRSAGHGFGCNSSQLNQWIDASDKADVETNLADIDL